MKKKWFVFLEFLIGGILMGIIEDIILIKILTDEPITPAIFIIIFLVTLPFAFIGEYLVDRIDFVKLFKLDKKYAKVEVFLEFLILGVFFGVIEDLIAFSLSIGNLITLREIMTALVIAVPFAFVGEFLIDRIDLESTFKVKKIIWKDRKIKRFLQKI